jgi:hypothetical protein
MFATNRSNAMISGDNLEIGLGGEIWFDSPSFSAWLLALRERVQRYDPAAKIDFLEMHASPENAQVAASHGMPCRQYTDLYVVGGGQEGRAEDALVTLRGHLEHSATMGTVTALNMQVWGNNSEPTIERLCEFYHKAEELAAPYKIRLFTETHIDRFTYDPRRLLAVHERLLKESGGRYGIRVGADFSHYVHQIGNSTGSNWPDIKSGKLNIDPFDPNNVISTGIVRGGLVGYGHMRMAVPNDLGRDGGSIQYPIVDPNSDPEQKAPVTLANGGAWDESRTRYWKEFYRQIFREQLSHPERPVARFSSEFITWQRDYRIDEYRNQYQNIAVLAWAQATKREILAELNCKQQGAKG